MEKDRFEKLAEARRIIEHSDDVTPEVGGAAFYLLEEVDRLAKIETGLQNLIIMKRQTHDALYEESVVARQPSYMGPHSAMELLEKAETLRGEIYALEALLEG